MHDKPLRHFPAAHPRIQVQVKNDFLKSQPPELNLFIFNLNNLKQ